MSKAKPRRLPAQQPTATALHGAYAAEMLDALGIDWSAIDWRRLLLELALVSVDWALLVLVPLLQKAGGPLAPIVSMALTSAKQILEQQLRQA
jgi:hypothetical protein